MTNVLDLNTGLFTLYTLNPIEAVVAAYAQLERQDFNTWQYSQYERSVTTSESIKPGVMVVTCGNQTCLCKYGEERIYHRQDYEVIVPKWTVEDELKAQDACNKARAEVVALWKQGNS